MKGFSHFMWSRDELGRPRDIRITDEHAFLTEAGNGPVPLRRAIWTMPPLCVFHSAVALDSFLLLWWNTQTKSNLEEEGAYFSSSPRPLSITEGKQGRNLKGGAVCYPRQHYHWPRNSLHSRGSVAETMENAAWWLTDPINTHTHTHLLPTIDWTLLHQLIVKTIVHRHVYRSVWSRQFPDWDCCLLRWLLGCAKLTVTANQDNQQALKWS